MGFNVLTRYPCVIMADGVPGVHCRAMDTATEAMLNTSALRVRWCETQLDALGNDYTDATITGPASGVYEPGKLITIITPHGQRTGRIKSWVPTHKIINEDGRPEYSVEFQMVVKFLTED